MSPRQNQSGANRVARLLLVVLCLGFAVYSGTASASVEPSALSRTHRVHTAMVNALDRQDIQRQLTRMGLSKSDALVKLNQVKSKPLVSPSLQPWPIVSIGISVLGLVCIAIFCAALTDRIGLTRLFTKDRGNHPPPY